MFIEAMTPFNQLILCRTLLLPPSIFSNIRVFSNESVFCIRWPKFWSFSFSISASNEYLGLISFRMDLLDLLAVQGTLKSLFFCFVLFYLFIFWFHKIFFVCFYKVVWLSLSSCIVFLFFKFYFIFKLYITVLVLPNIKMNPPQVSSKTSILKCSAFFIVQLSHPYMTTGKTIALTIQTFVGIVKRVIKNEIKDMLEEKKDMLA